MITKSLTTMRLPVLKLAVCLVACANAAGSRRAAGSPPPPVYDLDSLTWMSGAIVEARGVKSKRKEVKDVLYFQVQDTFQGESRKGEELFVEDIGSYLKPQATAQRSRSASFGAGDEVILFLERPRPFPYGSAVFDSSTWQCLSSGLRWLKDDRFHAVSQRYLGAIERMQPEKGADGQPLSADEFRESVRQSVLRVKALKQKVNAPLDAEQAKWLRDFIIRREHRPTDSRETFFGWHRDIISADASSRLAQWNQPEFLLESLVQSKARQNRSLISLGLATPVGRELLIKRLADKKLTLEERQVLAEAVSSIRFDYSQLPDFSNASVQPDRFGSIDVDWLSSPEPPQDNARWITRLTQIAMDERETPALSLAILSDFPTAASGFKYASAVLQDDWRGALQALAEHHGAITSPELRFAIEQIVAAIDLPRMQVLNPEAGPILSICRAMNEKRAPSTQRKLVFSYDTRVVSAEAGGAKGNLILRRLTSGNAYPFAFGDVGNSVGSGVSGQQSVPLPDFLPAGRYHVSLQFSRDGKVISRGYGFDINL